MAGRPDAHVAPDVEYIDLFAGREFSAKQAELIEWYRTQRERRQAGEPFEHIIVPVWGRRCGKSEVASALFSEMIVDELCDVADEIAAGTTPPWRGIGRPRAIQRSSKPHRLFFVAAPEGRDLVAIKGAVLDIFSGDAEVYLHPDPRMQVIDNGSKLVFLHEGACAQVWFVPTKQAAAMVGRGPAGVLLTESGFIPSRQWDRLMPSFWDRATWVIAEGTPEQDPSHWFTRLAVSGLEDGHPEADRSIAQRDPRVRTSRANTIDHAFLPQARERARYEAKYRGERWAKLWVYASWEMPADVVFDEFSTERSVVHFSPFPRPTVTFADSRRRILPDPDRIEMDVDWSQGYAPGAATVIYVWHRNPLSPPDARDPRPLILVVDEHQDDDPPEDQGGMRRLPYSRAGWWGVLQRLRDRWGVRRIYADPTGVELIKSARRAGIKIKPAENQDKAGRIQLLNAQCHTAEGHDHPALLISDQAVKTIKVLSTLQWRRGKDGRPTDKPSGYNDHLADCLCYAAGRWARPVADVPTRLI